MKHPQITYLPTIANAPPERVLWVPLWNGMFSFNATYNSNFEDLRIPIVMTNLRLAQVHVLVSGHGNDINGCGEFCPIAHTIEINDKKTTLNFTNAGTLFGCYEETMYGAMPNEYGTWHYGRNGWCDGNRVKPWVIDVTSTLLDTLHKNDTVVLCYNGKFQDVEHYNASLIPDIPGPAVLMTSMLILTYDSEPDLESSTFNNLTIAF